MSGVHFSVELLCGGTLLSRVIEWGTLLSRVIEWGTLLSRVIMWGYTTQ